MPLLSLARLRRQIASGETAPLYALVGADEAEKTAVAAEIAETVEEDLRAFNVERLYGGEISAAALIDAASTLPMMAPRRVVVVLEAEKLLTPKRDTRAGEAAQRQLEQLVDAPPAHATIVFVCGALDMRRRIAKVLFERAQVVDCGTIEDQPSAERWVKARAAHLGVSLEPAAVRALVERAGLDVARLRGGLERVSLYALGQATITADDVRQAVAPGPDTQADFGIAKAIWRDDARTALRELGLALDAGTPPVLIMGQLRTAAEKLPAGRIPAAIDAVFRTDLALKSSGGDPRVLLERLVVELCGAGAARGRGGFAPASLRR